MKIKQLTIPGLEPYMASAKSFQTYLIGFWTRHQARIEEALISAVLVFAFFIALAWFFDVKLIMEMV